MKRLLLFSIFLLAINCHSWEETQWINPLSPSFTNLVLTGTLDTTGTSLFKSNLYVGASRVNAGFTVTPSGVVVSSDSITFNNTLYGYSSQIGAGATIDLKTYRDASAGGSFINMYKARGTQTTIAVAQNNDSIGEIGYYGLGSGSSFYLGARLKCVIDGVPGSADMPARFEFHTAPDGSNAPIRRFVIDSVGATYFKPSNDLNTSTNTANGDWQMPNNLSVGQNLTSNFHNNSGSMTVTGKTMFGETINSPDKVIKSTGGFIFQDTADNVLGYMNASAGGTAAVFLGKIGLTQAAGISNDNGGDNFYIRRKNRVWLQTDTNGATYWEHGNTHVNVTTTTATGGWEYPSYVRPKGYTIAELKLITPTQIGAMYICTDSVPLSVYVSTGLGQYGFVKIAGGATD